MRAHFNQRYIANFVATFCQHRPLLNKSYKSFTIRHKLFKYSFNSFSQPVTLWTFFAYLNLDAVSQDVQEAS